MILNTGGLEFEYLGRSRASVPDQPGVKKGMAPVRLSQRGA